MLFSSANAPRAASRNSLYILLPEASFETVRDGGEVYAMICAGCHQPRGEGAIGAGRYPVLAGSATLEHSAHAIEIVLAGKGAMPPFRDLLDDDQVAAVLNYARGAALGNGFSPNVEAADVRRARR
ncbi:c-type cytochrome [Methylosinus sporium]|uniref:c-type cytochrome n=1 Tax=Methylosinus sporium TaxID=428 RepID=UPI00383A91F0